jgi:hypothetical protein
MIRCVWNRSLSSRGKAFFAGRAVGALDHIIEAVEVGGDGTAVAAPQYNLLLNEDRAILGGRA